MLFFLIIGSLTSYLGPVLGLLYEEFSFALYRYTHNVIASGLLSESLQNTLLVQLNVSPWIHDVEWPLQVLPRTLSVLAQVRNLLNNTFQKVKFFLFKNYNFFFLIFRLSLDKNNLKTFKYNFPPSKSALLTFGGYFLLDFVASSTKG